MTHANLNVKSTQAVVHNGVERNQRRELSQQLGMVLANSYALYAKTQGVHWNLVGPMFYSIHTLTDAQYRDFASSIDELAERIRALGFKAPAGLQVMSELSDIDSSIAYDNAIDMIESLVTDNETLSRRMRDVVSFAEKCEDVKTADLLTDRIGQLEENAWMLRSMIAE